MVMEIQIIENEYMDVRGIDMCVVAFIVENT